MKFIFKLSRDKSRILNYILDNFLPPVLRDSKLFMYLPLKIRYSKVLSQYFSFKEKAYDLTDTQIEKIVKKMEPTVAKLKRETDINKECYREILTSVVGKKILDIACGQAKLTIDLHNNGYNVTGADINISPKLINNNPKINFISANLEKLPFRNNEFDTVICAHTLEHVRKIHKSIQELRRVTKHRLIIVVPKQRPYKYTFDLHYHYFPYKQNLLFLMDNKKGNCKILGGDLFYYEDL